MTFSSSSFSSSPDHFGAVTNGYGAGYGRRSGPQKGADDPLGDLLGPPYNPFQSSNPQPKSKPQDQQANNGYGVKKVLNFLFGEPGGSTRV